MVLKIFRLYMLFIKDNSGEKIMWPRIKAYSF